MAAGSSVGTQGILGGSGWVETWLFPLSAYQLRALAADKSSGRALEMIRRLSPG